MNEGRRLSTAESIEVRHQSMHGRWRELIRQGYRGNDMVQSEGNQQFYPLWGSIVCLSADPAKVVPELLRMTMCDVNACDNQGCNFLWYGGRWKRMPELLQALLNAGLNAAHIDRVGRTYLDVWDSVRGWEEADLPWAKLLLDYGCPFPLKSWNLPAGTAWHSLSGYAVRVGERRAAARRAVCTMLVTLKRLIGRDLACLIGRLVWATRRGRTTWEPRETDK